MCTSRDTTSTGISIDVVRESKLKLHDTSSDSESTHLHSVIPTGVPLSVTSVNASPARAVVAPTHVHVTNWDPVTPIRLPNHPDARDPNIGSTMIAKYTIGTRLPQYL